MPIKSKKKRFSAVQEIPREQIITQPQLFQGRQSKWSQESVDKIVREGFDKSREPIEVWHNPETGKHIVISGHSRFEASRLLYEQGNLATLPVKVWKGDLESAIEYAVLESNRGSTSEGLLSDIQAFKLASQKGCNGECLRGYFKTNAYINSLQRLSNLNPKGMFLEKLSDPAQAKSFPNIQKYAEWVGELRKQYPKLTNNHENEIFKYLYLSGKSKLPHKKEDFVKPIERAVTNFFFDEKKPLNLQNFESKTPYVIAADAQIAELKEKIASAEKRIKQLRGLITKARKEKKTTLIEKFEEEITARNKEIIAHNEQIEKIGKDTKKAEKAAPGLFDNIDSFAGEETKEATTPDPVKPPELPQKNEEITVKTDQTKPEKENDIQLINYSEKSIALMGDTRPYAEQLGRKGLGGKFNRRLTNPKTKQQFAGWIFPASKREAVEEFLKTREVPEIAKVKAGEPSKKEKKKKSPLTLIQQLILRMFFNVAIDDEFNTDNFEFHAYYDQDGNAYFHSIIPRKWDSQKRDENIRVITKRGKIGHFSLDHFNNIRKSLIETEIPYEINIPTDKKNPHYWGIVINTHDMADRQRMNALILMREALLGKLEVSQYKSFDGMTDSWNHTRDLTWSNAMDNWWFWKTELRSFYATTYGGAYHSGQNLITIGNYKMRYIVGKEVNPPSKIGINPAKFEKKTEQQPQVKQEKSAKSRLNRAKKFRKKAETLQGWSDKKKEKLETALRNTPKRKREYNSKRIEAEIEEETAEVYQKIAEALENDTLSPLLNRLFVEPNNNPIDFFIAQRDGSRESYYDAFRASEVRYKTYDEKRLTAEGEKYGLESKADFDEVYEELQVLLGGKEREQKEAEKKKKQRLEELTDKWRFSKEDGFHPTPQSIISVMLRKAEVLPGNTVLEPSAGLGDIAEAVREKHPNNSIKVVEKWDSLREVLEIKGFEVVGSDTLAHRDQYDRVLMNPPFERHQDIQHVKHVFENNLKPGGRMVAIMSRSFDKNSRLKVRKEFNTWLDEVGAYVEELPDDAFKSSFRPTGVRTNLLVINKPEGEPAPITGNEKTETKAREKQEELNRKRKALALAKAKENERKRRLRLIQI